MKNKETKPRIYMIDLYKEWKIWSKCFGKVIVINGTSSSGKTTLSSYFNKLGFVRISLDDVRAEILKDHLNMVNPNLLAASKSFLNNDDLFRILFSKINNNYELTQRNIVTKLKYYMERDFVPILAKMGTDYRSNNLDAETEIYNRIYSKSKQFIFSGQHVVIDMIMPDNARINLFTNCFNGYPVTIALLYSPLEYNMKQCFLRNHLALKGVSFDMRNPIKVLGQFFRFYKIVKNIDEGKNSLEKLDKEKIIGILEYSIYESSNYIKILNNMKDIDNICIEQIVSIYNTIKDVYHSIELNNSQVYVVPNVYYDILIMSSNLFKIDCVSKKFDSIKEISDTRFIIYHGKNIPATIGGNGKPIITLDYYNKTYHLLGSSKDIPIRLELINNLRKEWSLWLKMFGKVILIVGPESSGKTTLAIKITENLSDWSTINRKKILQDTLDDAQIQLSFYNQLEQLSNILGHKVYNIKQLNEIKLDELDNINEKKVMKIRNEVDSIISSEPFREKFLLQVFSNYFDILKEYIFSGRNVVLDEVLVVTERGYDIFLHCFNNYSGIKRLLVFNTMEEILEKCIIRNNKFFDALQKYESMTDFIIAQKELERETGNSLSNYRMPKNIIDSYKNYYNFKKFPLKNDIVLAEITIEETKNIITRIAEEQLYLIKTLLEKGHVIDYANNVIDNDKELGKIFHSDTKKLHVVSKQNIDCYIKAPKVNQLELLDDSEFLQNLLIHALQNNMDYDDVLS